MVDHVTNTAAEDKDCWRTPPKIFDPLHHYFNFVADMAASDENHLLPMYFTEENSALDQRWPAGWKWINPPYSKPRPWVNKAAYYRESIMLVHLAVSSEWAKKAKRSANYIFQLQDRIQFVHAKTLQRGENSNMRDSQIIVWGKEKPGPKGAQVIQCRFDEIFKYLDK